jgi:hypothetical protein
MNSGLFITTQFDLSSKYRKSRFATSFELLGQGI